MSTKVGEVHLHLTDGTFDYRNPQNSQDNIPHDVQWDAFKLFWEQVYRIYKANEEESKIEEIKLVLLGDIFEMRSSTKWIESDYEEGKPRKLKNRPWRENKNGPSEICKKILKGILDHNEKTIRYLSPKKFDEIEEDTGLRSLIEELGKDKIKVEYISGNHDRLINFFDKDSLVVEFIEKQLGWAIPDVAKDRGFRYEDKKLGILADHGHKGEFIDYYADDYKAPPIGALVSDLVARLMYHIQREKENKELVRFCMDIDNVRPSSDRFTWLLTNLHALSEKDLKTFMEILITCIQELKQDAEEIFNFLYERVEGKIKTYHKVLLGIINLFVDKKKFLKKRIKKTLDKVESHLYKIKEGKESPQAFSDKLSHKVSRSTGKKKETLDQDFHFYERAKEEIETREGYNYVVYGHSHRYKLIPLITLKGGQKEKKVFYFNTGTWKKTVQKNLLPLHSKKPDFQKWTRMTYIIFFDWNIQQNKDHIFDIWHGNLQKREET